MAAIGSAKVMLLSRRDSLFHYPFSLILAQATIRVKKHRLPFNPGCGTAVWISLMQGPSS